jgi:hypothetical protein
MMQTKNPFTVLMLEPLLTAAESSAAEGPAVGRLVKGSAADEAAGKSCAVCGPGIRFAGWRAPSLHEASTRYSSGRYCKPGRKTMPIILTSQYLDS